MTKNGKQEVVCWFIIMENFEKRGWNVKLKFGCSTFRTLLEDMKYRKRNLTGLTFKGKEFIRKVIVVESAPRMNFGSDEGSFVDLRKLLLTLSRIQ